MRDGRRQTSRATFLNRRRPLDQQHADAAGIQEGDFLVRQLREELAADNLGVELCAFVDIADRNTEVSDALEFNHALLLAGRGKPNRTSPSDGSNVSLHLPLSPWVTASKRIRQHPGRRYWRP